MILRMNNVKFLKGRQTSERENEVSDKWNVVSLEAEFLDRYPYIPYFHFSRKNNNIVT